MANFRETLRRRTASLAERGLLRTRRVRSGPQATEVVVDGRHLINFNSNDYLGLAADSGLSKSFSAAVNLHACGSGASHLVSGHCASHHALEEELAAFCGTEKALLFSNGYMANVGVISALMGRQDHIFQDRLNHASLLDGAALSGAISRRYQHRDYAHLGQLLSQTTDQSKLIVSDGVFSMDGDLADPAALLSLASKHDAWVMLDDAHGIGVLGKEGRGILEHAGVGSESIDVLIGTLGKAFGTYGAFVAGSSELINFLLQAARTYIYSTAMPAALAEATRCSLKSIQEEHWRRERLHANIAYFRKHAAELGLPLQSSITPIQPIMIGDTDVAMFWSTFLFERGLWVSAIRPPTVPKGTSRLRVTLTAMHQRAQIDRLLGVFAELVAKKNQI